LAAACKYWINRQVRQPGKFLDLAADRAAHLRGHERLSSQSSGRGRSSGLGGLSKGQQVNDVHRRQRRVRRIGRHQMIDRAPYAKTNVVLIDYGIDTQV